MEVVIGQRLRTGKMQMFPLSPERIMDPEVSLREKAAAWLVQQGATTVLLFAIVYCLYAKTEVIFDRIERGYTRNAYDLRIVAEQHDKTIQKVIEQWKDDRALLLSVLQGKDSEEQSK